MTTAVDPVEEGLHAAGDDIDWQESAYLAWRDPATGLGGNHRIGNELNRGTANLWCGVYHESGRRYRHNGEDLPLERLDTAGLAAGPQRVFHDGDRLRFVLDGDGCRLDLVVDDDESTLAWAGRTAFAGSDGDTGTIFSTNYHAHCRVRGTATLGDRTVEVDARAWRDHSWGVRRWDSFLASRSFCGEHGSLRFRFGSMVGRNGSLMRHGALIRDGVALDVATASMLVNLDDDSMRCPSAEVRYELADGTTTTVRIDAIGGMVGATRERFGWECVGDATVDGEPGGWAFLEVNNNPRAGSAPPALVLADGLVNGLVEGP